MVTPEMSCRWQGAAGNAPVGGLELPHEVDVLYEHPGDERLRHSSDAITLAGWAITCAVM